MRVEIVTRFSRYETGFFAVSSIQSKVCGNDVSAQGIDLKNRKSVREHKFGGVLSQDFVIGLGTIRGASWIQILLKYVTNHILKSELETQNV